MPHESTVNPYDYAGEDMSHNIINRISRGSSLLNVNTTSVTNLAPGQDVSKLAQEASVKLNEYNQSSGHSPVTEKNRKLFYGSEAVEAKLATDNTIKRDSVGEQLVKPETPSELTHYEDLDDDDDQESDESKSSDIANAIVAN